jgi:hypothetical protein
MTDRRTILIGASMLAILGSGCGQPTSTGAPGKPGTNAVTIHVPGMEEQLKLR